MLIQTGVQIRRLLLQLGNLLLLLGNKRQQGEKGAPVMKGDVAAHSSAGIPTGGVVLSIVQVCRELALLSNGDDQVVIQQSRERLQKAQAYPQLSPPTLHQYGSLAREVRSGSLIAAC